MYIPLPRHEVFGDLANTQLFAAIVYGAFIRHTKGRECRVWADMLEHELDHTRYLHHHLATDPDQTIALPPIRFDLFHECVDRALKYHQLSAVERVELALRVEHAEIDFGLEGMLLQHRDHSPLPPYDRGVKIHYKTLLDHAQRYKEAREVAAQIARLTEHFPELGE